MVEGDVAEGIIGPDLFGEANPLGEVSGGNRATEVLP